MPQLVPFYFMNQVFFAYLFFILIIWVLSKWILPNTFLTFLARMFVYNPTFSSKK